MLFSSKSLRVCFFLPPGSPTSQDSKTHNKQIKHLWDASTDHYWILAIKSELSFKKASVQNVQMTLFVFPTNEITHLKNRPQNPKFSELGPNITTQITLTLKIVHLMAPLTEGFQGKA